MRNELKFIGNWENGIQVTAIYNRLVQRLTFYLDLNNYIKERQKDKKKKGEPSRGLERDTDHWDGGGKLNLGKERFHM